MSKSDRLVQLTSMSSDFERLFPALKPAQLERAAARGQSRVVPDGEVLVEYGTPNARMFLVTKGNLEIVRPTGKDEEVFVVIGPGQFTGEISILTGRRV